MKLPLSDRLKKCADKYTYFEGKELMLEAAAALAQQAQPGGPDYRCVMCDKPIPVGCKDCTEYALDAVGAPQQAQPNV